MTDRWNEPLRCPCCGRKGSTSLFQDEGDDMPTVDRISDDFGVLQTEFGPSFQCGICDVLAVQ